MRRLVLATMLIAAATAATAHQLRVFAFIEDGMVKVETKFSTGRSPVSGEVRVFGATEQLLMTLPLQEDGTAAFPLELPASSAGLMIEVEASDGHESYWLLTPEDIAHAADETES